MTPESVLAKSPKGIEEIEKRTYHLGSRLRQALIRIDGAKTLDEHLEMAGELADALFAQFVELERDGFIIDTTPVPTEPLASPPRAAAPEPEPVSAPEPADAPPESPVVSVDSPVRFRLGDLLVDAVGPETGKIGAALQACRTRDDLAKWVTWALPRIQEIAGKDKAKAFHKSAKQLVGG